MDWLIEYPSKYPVCFSGIAFAYALLFGLRGMMGARKQRLSEAKSSSPPESEDKECCLKRLWIRLTSVDFEPYLKHDLYQFVFNMWGAFLGWFAYYVLAVRAINDSGDNPTVNFDHFSAVDFILLFVAFSGVSGMLPQFSLKAAEQAARAVEAVAKKAG